MIRAAVIAFAVAGCYSPSYRDCQFQCSQAMTCPSGMDCVQGTCRIDGRRGACDGVDGGTDAGSWSAPEDLGLPLGFSDLSITKDGTELFMSRPDGQLYVSLVSGGSFGMPAPILELDTPAIEANPQVSADGLTLYFASTRMPSEGDADIWRTTRPMRNAPWILPTQVASLSSPSTDTGGSTDEDGKVLVMASPHGTARVDIFISTYNLSAADWQVPVLIPRLNSPIANTTHPCLDGTGTRLVFATDRDGDYNIWMSTRPDPAAQFEEPFRIDAVNTDDDEADPCLSTDGTTLYFARGPVNDRQIFRSTYTP